MFLICLIWLSATLAVAYASTRERETASFGAKKLVHELGLRWPLTLASLGVGGVAIWVVAKPQLWKALFDIGPSLDVLGYPMPEEPFSQMARTLMSLFPLPVLGFTVTNALRGARGQRDALVIVGLNCLPWLTAKVWGEQIDVEVLAYAAGIAPLLITGMAIERRLKRLPSAR